MKGIRSVQHPVASIIAAALLLFSAGAFSDQVQPIQKHTSEGRPAHSQTASVASVINLNKADVQTLAQLNGVGEKKAQAIVAYRESKGGFKSVDELLNVKGIGEKLLEKNRPLLSVN